MKLSEKIDALKAGNVVAVSRGSLRKVEAALAADMYLMDELREGTFTARRIAYCPVCRWHVTVIAGVLAEHGDIAGCCSGSGGPL